MSLEVESEGSARRQFLDFSCQIPGEVRVLLLDPAKKISQS
jgi:hypothetical protein